MASNVRPTGSARTFLLVAGAVVVAEALTCLVLAALSLADLSDESPGSGIGVALVLAAYGVFQGWAALQVNRGESWARSPLVVTQIIQVVIAFNLADVPKAVTLAIALSAGVALACLVSPPVNRALGPDGPV